MCGQRNSAAGFFTKASLPVAYVYLTELRQKGEASEKGGQRGQASEIPGSLSGPKVIRGRVPDQHQLHHPATYRNTNYCATPDLLNQKLQSESSKPVQQGLQVILMLAKV